MDERPDWRSTLRRLRAAGATHDELVAALPRFAGGDGTGPVFPEVPTNLGELDDAQLASLLEELEQLADKLASGDEAVVGELNPDEVLAEMQRGVEAIEAIRTVQDERAEAAAAHETRMAELAQRAARPAEEPEEGEEVEEHDDDPEASGDGDGDGEERKEEAIAASGARRGGGVPRRRAPARAGGARPAAREAEGSIRTAMTAAADIPGFSNGQPIENATMLGQAFVERRRNFGGDCPEGVEERIPIVRLRTEYPEARKLERDNQGVNDQRIQDVVGRQALVAAGGLCAPVTPLYDLPVFGIQDRPVRDALPPFEANRGGIIFQVPPLLSEITTGVGIITAAQDAAGGAPATKTCQVVTCPPTTEVDVNIVFRCIQFANLTARTHPERVAQFTEHVMIAHAQIAEVRLLDGIKAASLLITAANPSDGGTPAHVLGAAGTWLGQIAVAAAAYRNRHRMDPEARLRLMAPAWILDALQVDGLRKAFHSDGVPDDASLVAGIRALGVEPTWYLDSPTGDGQMFPEQADGALLPFPPTVSWFLFAEGTFLYLDGGELDLGLVRDSTLNRTNNYQVFGESFENVAKVAGVESLNVVSAICPNGATGGSVQLACPAV